MNRVVRLIKTFSGILLFGGLVVAVSVIRTTLLARDGSLSKEQSLPAETETEIRSRLTAFGPAHPALLEVPSTIAESQATETSVVETLVIDTSVVELKASGQFLWKLPRQSSVRQLSRAHPSLRDGLPLIGNFSKTHWADNLELPRQIYIHEYDSIIELLRVVDDVFRRASITYAMIGGTLLGSYYHHDMIPWDDDADLVLDIRDRHRAFAALNSTPYHANYSVMEISAWPLFKFYMNNGLPVSSYTWKWPYIDIFFFKMTQTKWWLTSDTIFPLDVVFPLHLRPFGPLWLPSPNDAKRYIDIEQKMGNSTRKCQSNSYNHLYELQLQPVTMSCERLMRTYPFVVDRRPAAPPWQSIEIVRINDETVQEVAIPLAG